MAPIALILLLAKEPFRSEAFRMREMVRRPVLRVLWDTDACAAWEPVSADRCAAAWYEAWESCGDGRVESECFLDDCVEDFQ